MNPSNGGPCQGIRNSVPQLAKMGVDTDVLCMDDPDSDFIKHDDFKIIPIGASKTSWAYHAGLKSWLNQHLAEYDAVVVHGIWQYHDYATNNVMKHLKAKGTPNLPKLFVMPHGMLDPYFQKAEGRKLKAIRNYIYWKLIEADVIENADGLLFTCNEEMRLAAQSFTPYKPKKTINVTYGIGSPPSFSDQFKTSFENICPQSKDRAYLLFLSRVHEKKGVDILLDAYQSAYSSHDENSLPLLVIAGPGMESEFGKSLKQKVENDGFLERNVQFVGMLRGDEKWGAMYGAEAFVLPSHQENFGIAVAEALACSLPVLISDKVNIHFEIAGANAGIIENDDRNGVEKMLKNWINTGSEERNAMGERAKELYEKSFDIESSAGKFLLEIQNNLN